MHLYNFPLGPKIFFTSPWGEGARAPIAPLATPTMSRLSRGSSVGYRELVATHSRSDRRHCVLYVVQQRSARQPRSTLQAWPLTPSSIQGRRSIAAARVAGDERSQYPLSRVPDQHKRVDVLHAKYRTQSSNCCSYFAENDDSPAIRRSRVHVTANLRVLLRLGFHRSVAIHLSKRSVLLSELLSYQSCVLNFTAVRYSLHNCSGYSKNDNSLFTYYVL